MSKENLLCGVRATNPDTKKDFMDLTDELKDLYKLVKGKGKSKFLLVMDALQKYRDELMVESSIDINNKGGDNVTLFNYSDKALEGFWRELGDVPMDDEECIGQDWRGFDLGTEREEIWTFFDQHHSKGVAYLLYGKQNDQEK